MDKYRTSPSSFEATEETRKKILSTFVQNIYDFDYLNRVISSPCLKEHSIWFYMGNPLLIKPDDRAKKSLSGDLDEIRSVELIETEGNKRELRIETYENYILATTI